MPARQVARVGRAAWTPHLVDDAPAPTTGAARPGALPPRRRTRKYRALKVVLRVGNRVLRLALAAGLPAPAFAVLETTGRRTGVPRRTPVGNGLVGDTFWLIAAHGTQADFVRNIEHHPTVRVLVGRHWRSGVAVALPDDDPGARSRTHPYPWDAAIGRALATTPLTIRIDLEPVRNP